jgi:hypothetical protein
VVDRETAQPVYARTRLVLAQSLVCLSKHVDKSSQITGVSIASLVGVIERDVSFGGRRGELLRRCVSTPRRSPVLQYLQYFLLACINQGGRTLLLG